MFYCNIKTISCSIRISRPFENLQNARFSKTLCYLCWFFMCLVLTFSFQHEITYNRGVFKRLWMTAFIEHTNGESKNNFTSKEYDLLLRRSRMIKIKKTQRYYSGNAISIYRLVIIEESIIFVPFLTGKKMPLFNLPFHLIRVDCKSIIHVL